MRAYIPIMAALLVILAGCTQQAPPAGNGTVACTEEARVCPDGSTVGRVGPDCEFAPCPAAVVNDSAEPDDGADGQMVGNDTDEHGCIGSAGYTWCEILKECVREWEKPCVVPEYTVKTGNSRIGEILVGGDGMSLYTFSDDSEGESACYGQCAVNWPPLLVTDMIAIPTGLEGTFGAIGRNDSTMQVTYNGMPLYFYRLDDAPGDINGDGVNGKWYAAQPSE